MRTLVRMSVALVGLLLIVNARAAAGKISMDKVPKPVLDATKGKFPDAELVSAEKEDEDGKLIYEIGLKDKNQKVDVELAPDGKILVIERMIAAKDLPKEIAQAVQSKHPKATIRKAEEIIKEDKVTAYEVLLVTARRKRTFEVVFDASGKFVKEEQKKAKEKEAPK